MSSSIESYDSRWGNGIFEAHYWPTVGRVLLIHIPAGTSLGPILTDVRIQHTPEQAGSGWLNSTTMLTAKALAAFGDPAGEVFIHGENGSTLQLDPATMIVSAVYPPINPVRIHA